MVTAIVVKIELGHIAQFRDIPTLDGHTHDWMVFVKGADGIDIEHFVEKVVFWLHESYGPLKHVIKAPPYEVKKTGYAGFNMLIDIHFKNKSEPKTVRFHYDMFLHMETMPPVNHTRIEMLTFTSPADDFKKKLLRAGGVLQVQDGSSQGKEKKQKEIGHSDSSKHRQSNESDKKSKSGMKSHKQKSSSKDESKRRSSITEADLLKKKKIEEKLNSSAPIDKKPREKLNKIKIKIEKGQPPSLFSREESIDIKQIKKKEPSKREDVKPSEKRPSPPEVKIKKESSERIEKFPEKRKKEKKAPPRDSVPKIKQEMKQKKRRTMSSSDSDLAPPKKIELMQSDSDSEEERRIRKKIKKEKLKEAKKLAKKMKKEDVRKPSPLPAKRDNTELMDMDICETPPRESFVVNSDTSFARSSAPNSAKEKRHKLSKPREKITTTPTSVGNQNKEVLPDNSPQSKRKKEKTAHLSSTHKERSSTHSSGKKPRSKPTPNRESRLQVTSDSDSSAGEQERPSSRQQVFQQDLISPIRSSSESPSPVHSPLPRLLLHKEPHDVTSHTSDDAASVSSRDDRDSDSDGDLFEENSPQHRNQKSFSAEKKRPVGISPPGRVPRPPSPMVTVSVGTELKSFPGLNADLFEQLKQLQQALSQIRDAAVKKKVRSIVQKSGQFAMDGDAMDFDLCALDRKTIHKIQKHLKVH